MLVIGHILYALITLYKVKGKNSTYCQENKSEELEMPLSHWSVSFHPGEGLRILQGLSFGNWFYSIWLPKTGHNPCIESLPHVLCLISFLLFFHIFLLQLLCRECGVRDGWLNVSHGICLLLYCSGTFKNDQIQKGGKAYSPGIYIIFYD